MRAMCVYKDTKKEIPLGFPLGSARTKSRKLYTHHVHAYDQSAHALSFSNAKIDVRTCARTKSKNSTPTMFMRTISLLMRCLFPTQKSMSEHVHAQSQKTLHPPCLCIRCTHHVCAYVAPTMFVVHAYNQSAYALFFLTKKNDVLTKNIDVLTENIDVLTKNIDVLTKKSMS
jgi:hypothetical protein